MKNPLNTFKGIPIKTVSVDFSPVLVDESHGVDEFSRVKHKKGCGPRAVSIVFGKKLGMTYDQIVESFYEIKRAAGKVADFNKDGTSTADWKAFAEKHGLKFIEYNHYQRGKDVVRLYPTAVFGTCRHAVPFIDGVQQPNTRIYGRVRVGRVLTA